jgi:hypothetical protein
MMAMSNGHHFCFKHRAPRRADTRAAHALAPGWAFFRDIVNFVTFAVCRPLSPLSLRAA